MQYSTITLDSPVTGVCGHPTCGQKCTSNVVKVQAEPGYRRRQIDKPRGSTCNPPELGTVTEFRITRAWLLCPQHQENLMPLHGDPIRDNLPPAKGSRGR